MAPYANKSVIPTARTGPLDRLRAELADLAFDLERQGRLDAADIVMQIEGRVRELASTGGAGGAEPGPETPAAATADPEPCSRMALSP